jgi:tripartite-type tricarboxylate transporter receptor subunit TctC
MTHGIKTLCAAAVVVAAVLCSGLAAAQTYPTKPVRLIIPFPPGGSNDIVGRLVAAQLSERLGKQVVVDNRAGAGGVVGTESAAKSPADGHTLVIVSAAHAINAALYKLPYDHEKAFVPIAKLGGGPNALTVHPSVPVSSVKELIGLMKQKPGQLIISSAGVGTFSHLASELFKTLAGADAMIVQFKGGGPAMIDTIGGHSHVTFGSLVQQLPHIKSGKLKVLGTGGSKRSAILPDVPTIAEAGVPGYEATNWWGILAPAGTPKALVDRLDRELAAVLTSAEVQKRFASEGADIDHVSQAEFGRFIAAETAKWGRIITSANIKAE